MLSIIYRLEKPTCFKSTVRERKKKMKDQINSTKTLKDTERIPVKGYRKDAPGATSGINTPGIDLPAFNPPVPNRAWTAMKKGMDIDSLTEEEKRDLYLGNDNYF